MKPFAARKKKQQTRLENLPAISKFPASVICSNYSPRRSQRNRDLEKVFYSVFSVSSVVNSMEYPLQYYPAPLAKLLEELMKLPGIGIKSAQRIAFHILKMPVQDQQDLIDSLSLLKEKIRY